MPRGGKREGAGRKEGSASKKTREIADKAVEEGLTPLEFMLQIMRNDQLPEDADPAQKVALTALRFEAAKAAAPYVHPKLSAVEMNANVTQKTLAQELAELNAQSNTASH